MQLDYIKKTGSYILRVPRGEGHDIPSLMNDVGFDFSDPASTAKEAVLFTHEPYAAVSFVNHATPRALIKLGDMAGDVRASWAKESTRHIDCPADKELWPFQKAGVDYVLNRQNALIGDQVGLGKTPQAICIANEMQAQRVLVLCPANIRLQWARMVREWSVMTYPYIVYPIIKSANGVHPRAEWTIVSYDLARSEAIHNALLKGEYDLLILDEGHYLKTPGAKRTHAVFGGGKPLVESLASRCEAIVALTGTPLPNRPRECYTLSRGLCWDSIDWMSEAKFMHRFNPSRRMTSKLGNEYYREETGRLGELKNRLRANFMVRRLKRDVLTQLPDIVHDITYVEESGDVKKALSAERMLDIDPEDLSGVDAEILGHISVVRRQMGVAMAPLVADYVDMIMNSGENKLLLVGWHIDVLNILEERLSKWGLVRVDGRTSPYNRQKAVDDFIADPSIRIFEGNLQSIGVGVDGLQTVASHIILAECSWTPADNEQVIGRLERIGQENAILAEFMVAPGSFSERVLGTALRKLKNIHSSLDTRD